MSVLEVKDKVQRYMVDWLGNVEIDRDGDFHFPVGSTRVFIRVLDWNDKVLVQVEAPLVLDATRSPELYEYVATEGSNYFFGKIRVLTTENESECTLVFNHILLGDFLDPEELKVAVGAVASTSDDIDDDLAGRFGGRVMHSD